MGNLKEKWIVLIVIFVASTLGLISLGLPEPTTFTFTTTPAVTGPRSSTYTKTLVSEYVWTSSHTPAGYQPCMSTPYGIQCLNPVDVCQAGSYFAKLAGVVCLSTYTRVESYTSVWVTASTVTSSLIETGQSTKMVVPFYTSDVNRAAGSVLIGALLLGIALMISLMRSRKRREKQATLSEFVK